MSVESKNKEKILEYVKIEDISFADIDISENTKNVLHTNNKNFISDIILVSNEEICKFRNIDKEAAIEIVKCKNDYLKEHKAAINEYVTHKKFTTQVPKEEKAAVKEVKTVDKNSLATEMVENLTSILKRHKTGLFLEEIYSKYEALTGKKLTEHYKLILKVTLEMHSSDTGRFNGVNDMFAVMDDNKWALRKNKTSSAKKENKKPRTLTPKEKLLKRVKREAIKVKYLGDINIDDEEYELLVEHLRYIVLNINQMMIRTNDILFALALVQIGIQRYNGRYWPHVSETLNVKIDGNKQRLLGERFYYTLKANNKFVGEPNSIVNNILMHCYVTNYYADDLFDFLFAYYQKDLNRDLEQHTKEMREYLMSSMKKSEDSARAYKIKKGTADAVTANENGCKIRVRHVLNWIDDYLFNDVLPENSSNRVAKLFVKWAKKSTNFNFEKHGIIKNGKARTKIFRYPYLNFDTKNGEFCLILPVQTIPLSNDEDSAKISWRISHNGEDIEICSDVENTVIGCKTLNVEKISLQGKDIFSKFKIELIKNEIYVIKIFTIFEDDIRFFDEDFNIIHDSKLYEGTVYAFSSIEQSLETSCEVYKEEYDGLNLYTLNLESGDIVKKSSGKAIVVGENLPEGIIKNSAFVDGCYSYFNNQQYEVFNRIPNILFSTKQKSEKGILIFINNQKYKFEKEKCVEFKQNEADVNWYLLKLDEYCDDDGLFEIKIDIPNDRKSREYSFVLMKNLSFTFVGAPYIFAEKGQLVLPEDFKVIGDKINKIDKTTFEFELSAEIKNIEVLSQNNINLFIQVPLLKWKTDSDDTWRIDLLEDIWHKELPDNYYIDYIGKKVELYSKHIDIDSEIEACITSQLNKESGVSTLETRKVKSWLETGPVKHQLYLKSNDFDCAFVSVITRCALISCDVKSDIETNEIIVKSKILGFSDCVIDVFCDGEQIAKKLELKASGISFKSKKLFGEFEVVFYEQDDDDEFDFGVNTFNLLTRKQFNLVNKNDLNGCFVKVDFITEGSPQNSIFAPAKYYIKDFTVKNILWNVDENAYIGTSSSSIEHLNDLRVAIELVSNKYPDRAFISFYSDEEECFLDFLYDNTTKTMVTEEVAGLSNKEAQKRYIMLDNYMYYKISVRKKEGY